MRGSSCSCSCAVSNSNSLLHSSPSRRSSLPPSFKGMSMENDGDATTLRHWVEELDVFQEKWSLFRDNVVADIGANQDGGGGGCTGY